MRFLILGRSVGQIEKKKPKKNHKKSRNGRPWYPRTTLKVNILIFGLTKCTIYSEKCYVFVPVFLCAVTMLIFQIKRIMPKMPKIWVHRMTVNGEKKEDDLKNHVTVGF